MQFSLEQLSAPEHWLELVLPAVFKVIVIALGQIGINTNSLAAVVGGAALAVGLSLQNQLSAFAAGVLLILFRPFKVGDFVDAGNIKGIVEEIKIIHTILRTQDNQEVIVPNNLITATTITNYSARATRRLDITLGIDYDADLLNRGVDLAF